MNNDKNNKVKESKPLANKYSLYTYDDYLNFKDDKRYELINGKIYCMSPAPSRKHQQISGELFRQIANFFFKKNCEIYSAPFDIRLTSNDSDDKEILTVVQPDISVICDKNKLDKKGGIGAPDLIIEIISPATGLKDRKIKRKLYEKHRVKEYWIVDYHEKTVEIYLLNKNNKYDKSYIYGDDDVISTTIFSNLKINLNDIWNL